jgi:hypothetical protein
MTSYLDVHVKLLHSMFGFNQFPALGHAEIHVLGDEALHQRLELPHYNHPQNLWCEAHCYNDASEFLSGHN